MVITEWQRQDVDLPGVWLCNTRAILQAGIPVYPQEYICRQLQDLAVKLADV